LFFCFKRPQEIIVFIIGGITYEETLAIQNINKAYSGSNLKVILGGTFIHNFNSFIDEVLASNIQTNSDDRMTTTTVDETRRFNTKSALASAMRD
jgi:hypothetical protein